MTTPDSFQTPLGQSIVDYINGLPQIDGIPENTTPPAPAADPSDPPTLVVVPSLPSGASFTHQPAEAAYGVCLFAQDDLEAATAAARDWQFQLTAESGADIAAVLTHLVPTETQSGLDPCWALVWLLPRYPTDNSDQIQAALNRWTAGPAQCGRGTRQYCVDGALQLLVNSGFTRQQAVDHLATALKKLQETQADAAGGQPNLN